MKYFLLVYLTFMMLQLQAASTAPADSIGLKVENGATFILHQVEEKETLYSLSRRYNVSIHQIIDNNPPTEFGLEIGQMVKIPLIKKEVQAPHRNEVVLVGDGKTHVVQAKETIFSISRMYNVTIDEVKKWNGLSNNLLEIGQEIVIKPNKLKTTPSPVDHQVTGRKTHIVSPGETLYAISRQYKLTIDELKQWNSLPSNEISIGQELVVEGKKESSTTKDNKEVTESSTPVVAPVTIEEDLGEGGSKPVESEPVEEQVLAAVDRTVATTKNTGTISFEEVSEAGMAELIEGSENTRKYLALHRTAKVGTILKVTNEMNGQEVFVRVLSKLPDTGVNKNVLIKISKSAYDRLGAIDPKFRVSISYIP